MAYELPKLAYEFSALEPYIDAQTVEIHYTKHHQTYVDKLNAALATKPELSSYKVEELLAKLEALVPAEIQAAVRNMGGGYLNHNLYWETMIPGGSKEPQAELAKTINSKWTDFATFSKELSDKALGQFGSGWAWLVVNSSKELELMATANQDSPLLTGKTPILGVDVWEHAYYLKYQNKRPDYVQAWWNLVNWDVVTEKYQQAVA